MLRSGLSHIIATHMIAPASAVSALYIGYTAEFVELELSEGSVQGI